MDFIKRFLRYSRYFLIWMFREKIHGLDFTMRNKSLGISSLTSHGYAKSPEFVLKRILSYKTITSADSFLDIGCGKGYVLYIATSFPFGRIAGIELEPFLVEIAKKNFMVLNLPNIEIYLKDATLFDRYSDFNYFYLYNPFSIEIYRIVLEKIFTTLRSTENDRNVMLLCYGQSDNDAINNSGLFSLLDVFIEEEKGSAIHIWEHKVPVQD